jgi:hypothetical protein
MPWPPGAALEAVRGDTVPSTSSTAQYFVDNGVAAPLWVLAAWAAGGLSLLGAAGARDAR